MEARDLAQHSTKVDRKSLQVQTQARNRRTKVSQLWQDIDTNKFFKIDGNTGNTIKVNTVGDSVKKYYQSVSGTASFAHRVAHA